VPKKIRSARQSSPRARPVRRAAPSRSGRTRIVVADAQAIDRGGIIHLLEDQRDFEVVGESATVAETIQECRALEPDVLVLSLNLPGQQARPAIPEVHSELPALRIVAISERGADNCLVLNPPSRAQLRGVLPVVPLCATGTDCLQLAARQGAMATLRRSADPEDLFRAVRAVAQGHAWYDPTTAAGMLSSAGSETGPGGGKPVRFSQRELQVAALIAEGQSNKEISTSLRISEPTVKKHVGHILSKLGVPDRLQAGLFIARHPLLLQG
jgi:DNA-binding NarL/FixJ family response regulator